MRHFLYILVIVLMPWSCAVGQEVRTLVSSIHPLALLAKDLVGDKYQIKTLLEPNQEPHHLSLTISQRRLLDTGDLVLWVGPGLESYLADTMMSSGFSSKQLGMAALAREKFSDLPAMESDPHLWLNPEIALHYYRQMAEALIRSDPASKNWVHGRLADTEIQLTQAVAEIRDLLEALRGRSVVVDHQAYGHFARYFGIQIAGALVDENGIAVGAKSFARLKALNNVACVVVEQLPPSQGARTLASSLGVEVVAIDPMGFALGGSQGYVELLKQVAEGFERCLSRD